MKKYTSVLLAIALVLSFGTIAMAALGDGLPGNGIQNTWHDLSTGGLGNAFSDDTTFTAPAGAKDRICVYCHAPHSSLDVISANPAFDYLPLWNHANTTLVDNYIPYTNGDFLPGQIDHQFNGIDSLGQPGGVSLLCLSCHDGSIAVNEYGYAPSLSRGGAGAGHAVVNIATHPRALIGGAGNLSNHHPIGFDYDAVAAVDFEIRTSDAPLPGATANPVAAGGVKANGPQTIGDLLANGMMECVTCHDVHNTKNGGTKFTWVDDLNSNFCFTCHMKDGGDVQSAGFTY